MAGDTRRNIAKGSYGDRFGRGAGNKAENKSQGEDGYATRPTKEPVKRDSNLMKASLRRSMFHRGNTAEQFLRHAKDLRNLSDAGVSAPLEGGDNVSLSFTVSLIVTFTKRVTVLWECYKKNEAQEPRPQ